MSKSTPEIERPATTHELFEHLASGQHGHFAAKLAQAWFQGDSHNRRLIEDTWPHLLAKARAFLEPIK